MPLVRAGELDLYCQQHGAGPPLLCIMGLGLNHRGWERQVPAFASRFRTIVFDNRGVGRSGKPDGPYRTAELARDALALLDALGIARTHVLGLSMGGMIAQELALAAPERIDRLVLASTYDRATREFVQGAQSGAVGVRLEELGELAPRQLFERMLPFVLSEAYLAAEGARAREWFAGLIEGFSLRGFLGQLGAVFTHDARGRLGEVRAPTLVLTGTADRMIPCRCSERIAAAIPGAQLRLFDGGSHGLSFEQPELWNAEVLRFLAG